MFEEVRKIIAELLELDPDEITMESTWGDLGIDSLDVVDTIYDLESTFGIKLPDDELEDIRTIGDLASLVQRKL